MYNLRSVLFVSLRNNLSRKTVYGNAHQDTITQTTASLSSENLARCTR
jgi:hypothetical protein